MKRTKYTKIFLVRSVFFVVNALPADAADVVLIIFVVTEDVSAVEHHDPGEKRRLRVYALANLPIRLRTRERVNP
jgi:hypothetical protein